MSLDLTLVGNASLIHIQNPSTELGQRRDEYFVRIQVARPSLRGREKPLDYDIPVTREDYDLLNSLINADDFRDPVHEAEGYKNQPRIAVKCNITLTPKKGD